MPETLRVLIVDDSRIFRAALQRALEQVDDVKVVGSVWDGAKAVEFLKQHPVDLVTLDMEMPNVDGLATLRELNRLIASQIVQQPVAILLLSAHTQRGAKITIEGLELGAFDFITKPAGTNVEDGVAKLRDELALKIRSFRSRRRIESPISQISPAVPKIVPVPSVTMPRGKIRAICIAVSTGGPQALVTLLPELTALTSIPILIVQHMPVGFTAFLAESLTKRLGKDVREAVDGEAIQSGKVYLSPGGRHLLVRARSDGNVIMLLNEQPPVNGCRPSCDVLLRSAATVFGAEAIGIVLTGMGQDGGQGLLAMKRAGALTIAQDEATSVVWGMPGYAAQIGAADRVLPLSQIPVAVAAFLLPRG